MTPILSSAAPQEGEPSAPAYLADVDALGGTYTGDAYFSTDPATRFPIGVAWSVRPVSIRAGPLSPTGTYGVVAEFVGRGQLDGLPLLTVFVAEVFRGPGPDPELAPARCQRLSDRGGSLLEERRPRRHERGGYLATEGAPVGDASAHLLMDPELARRLASESGRAPAATDWTFLHPCETTVNVLMEGLPRTLYADLQRLEPEAAEEVGR